MMLRKDKGTSPRRAIIGSVTSLIAYFLLADPVHGSFMLPPDARALLQGVENSRQATPPGRLEWEVTHLDHRQPKAGVSRTRLVVAFDGLKRRFDQYQRILWIDGSKPGSGDGAKKLKAMGGDREAFVRAGLGEFRDVHIRSAFDGSQFMQYNEEMGAYIRDASKGSADYAFDPRALGISVWNTLDSDVPSSLGYRDGKSVAMVGPEVVGGHPSWHVLVMDKLDRERHFWIDARDFRVYRVELRSKYQHYISEPEYDEPEELRNLPSRVVIRNFGRDGNLNDEVTFTAIKRQECSIDPKNWTLAGLGMPLGEMMIDERTHRVVGHYDGEGLTPSLPNAIQKGRAARWKPLHWGMVVTGGVILAVLAAVVVRRKNWLREGA
jgi:hypothetical protein